MTETEISRKFDFGQMTENELAVGVFWRETRYVVREKERVQSNPGQHMCFFLLPQQEKIVLPATSGN